MTGTLGIELAFLVAGLAPLSPPDAAQSVPLAPHVRVDWSLREVAVDAEIVLRSGPLELLVCTTGTREHESIMATRARPLDIYHALGLLGAEPGSPPAWDDNLTTAAPATGWPLAIDVSYEVHGTIHRHGADKWLRDSAHGTPVGRLHWIFCGSTKTADGGLSADLDGTVVCLVDFDTALIALPESHSADNAMLWVEPDTGRVPAVGTPCTLILRPLDSPVLRAMELGRYGEIRYDGRLIGFDALASELHSAVREPATMKLQVNRQQWTLEADYLRLLARTDAMANGAIVIQLREVRPADAVLAWPPVAQRFEGSQRHCEALVGEFLSMVTAPPGIGALFDAVGLLGGGEGIVPGMEEPQ